MTFNHHITTTFVLSNLHCPSCVSQIELALSGLGLKPSSFSCSILDQTVTLTHPSSLASSRISSALENAGFDVYREDGSDQAKANHAFRQAAHRWLSLSPSVDGKKRSRHLETCEYCRGKHKISDLSTKSYSSTGVPGSEPDQSENRLPAVKNEADQNADAPFVAIGHDNEDVNEFSATVAISGMTCSSCTGSITRALEEEPWVRAVNVNLLSHSANVVFIDITNKSKIIETIEDVGFDASIEEVVPAQHQKPSDRDIWRATYAIGGMTCSSCVGTITSAIKQLKSVREVDVNLISHIADVVIEGKENPHALGEIIEDVGFEAELVNLEPFEPVAIDNERPQNTVMIRIGGMFCPQCPVRVQDAVARLEDVQIEKAPTTDQPTMSVVYRPSPPDFTIRTILDVIANLDPKFVASIDKPPSLEDRQHRMQSQQQRRITYRVVLSILAAIPTFIIGIVYMTLVSNTNRSRIYLMETMKDIKRGDWATFILATFVYFFAADIFHRRTLKELRALWRPGSRTPILRRFYRFGSMNTLVSLGTSIAYWSSIAELAISASRSGSRTPNSSSTPYYFDSVVFLTLFLLIGRLIEAYSKSKAGDAVSALADLRPKTAVLVTITQGEKEGAYEKVAEVSVDLVEAGDIVRVVHGASPPFDGNITHGTSKFDESSLTGESKLVSKEPGDEVFTGTVNKGDAISIKVIGGLGSSMLDKIMSVVREGQTKRAPVERIADMLTGVFVPIITLLAILTWLIWLALGLSGALSKSWLDIEVGGWPFWSLQFAIAVFVVACPCGLGLAAPTALFVGGGLAAKKGILVRGGGEAFQEASGLDIVAFDKTGTLTQGGLPQVTDSASLSRADEEFSVDTLTALAIVRELERDSSHPIARALVDYCNSVDLNVQRTGSVREIPGRGMLGSFTIDNRPVEALVGNEALMQEFNVAMPSERSTTLDSWKAQGKSVALLALKRTDPSQSTTSATPSSTPTPPTETTWTLTAIFAISDPLRPEAASVIAALHKRNVAVWMISGDNQATAHAIGEQLSIQADRIIAGVLPAAKADTIKYLQSSQTKRPSTSSRLSGAWHRLLSLFRLRRRSSTTPKPHRATVAFIGDGINDAPALTAADVSIAIGSGSDVALASASFILLHSDLRSLLTLLDLSRVVFRRVAFNFAWALVYNVVLVPVAAGCFYGIGTYTTTTITTTDGEGGGEAYKYKGVRLDPAWAALAMAGSSVSVVVSSLALRWRWLPWVGFRDRSGVGLGGGAEGEASATGREKTSTGARTDM